MPSYRIFEQAISDRLAFMHVFSIGFFAKKVERRFSIGHSVLSIISIIPFNPLTFLQLASILKIEISKSEKVRNHT